VHDDRSPFRTIAIKSDDVDQLHLMRTIDRKLLSTVRVPPNLRCHGNLGWS